MQHFDNLINFRVWQARRNQTKLFVSSEKNSDIRTSVNVEEMNICQKISIAWSFAKDVFEKGVFWANICELRLVRLLSVLQQIPK